ncbi:choice-of-anchor Q domain-containing protein [Hymenobacter terrenus]|uniref:choice-of-anchor Q domain-containing protein n=1 Tax=Hymenobacter terrenus TaxID=1629124 RepID=UPI00069832F7|nr:choice-of-anchor Q domain-containing protein [Hymenobacter terrenus]
MKALLLTAFLGIGVSAKVAATTYYVSSGANSLVTGVNATGGGRGLSPGRPFATIQYAADRTNPGDTVFVRQGTYVNQYSYSPGVEITRSGAPGQWIVYHNYPGDTQKPLLQFNTWEGFKLVGNISYIEINGFRVQGNNRNVNLADATNQPRSCALNGAGTPEGRYNGNGILSRGTTTVGSQNPHHLRFLNNEIFECGGAGIGVLQSDYVTVENNLIYDTSWYTIYATSGISIYQAWNYDTAPGYHIIVRNNRCFGNRLFVPWWRGGTFGCMGITDGNGIIIDDSKNTQNSSKLGAYTSRTLVANNLVVNNGGTGMHSFISEHVDFINNTSYHNSQSPEINDGEMYANRSNDVLFQNNILSADAGQVVNSNGSSNTNIRFVNNLYFGGTTVAVAGTNTVRANPQFVNPTTNWATADFRLASTSPAINAGVNNLLSTVDLAGNPRLVGANVDLGAYESTLPLSTAAARASMPLQIFPNPTHGTVELSLPRIALGSSIRVFDAVGRLCLSQPVAGEKMTLSVANLPAGVYSVQVQTPTGRLTQRLSVD